MDERLIPNTNAPASQLERATTTLGVPSGAPPAAVRAAFLRRLPSAGLVPPPEWRSAVRVLTGQPDRSPAALADPFVDAPADDALRAEVEAFAESFWSYAPADRRQRWQALLDRCTTDRPLTARLRRLEAGVDLESIRCGAAPSRSEELAGMVQELFVLKPSAAAACRRTHITALRAPASAWAEAARQLLEYQPALAALEPALIERLTALPLSRAGRTTTDAGPAWSVRIQGGPQVPRVPAPVRHMSHSTRWLLLAAILLVTTLVRTGMSNRTNTNYRLPPDTSSATPLPPRWQPSNAPPHIGSTTIDDDLRTRQKSPLNDPSWLVPDPPPGRWNGPPQSLPPSQPPAPIIPTPMRPGGGQS